MRKIVSYTLLFACLSSNVTFASDAVHNYISGKQCVIASSDPNIKGLIAENKRLSSLLLRGVSQVNNDAIAAIKGKLIRLEAKNALLEKTLQNKSVVSVNHKEVYVSRNNNAHNTVVTNTRRASEIMINMDKLQRENADLRLAISNNKPDISNSDMQSLKSQNKSLRETIRAQSVSLVSADNSGNAADKLLTKNLILQRKMEELKQSSVYNGKSAKELFVHNKFLQDKILKRDNYINKMQMLRAISQKLNANKRSSALPVVDTLHSSAGRSMGGEARNGNLNALLNRNETLENDLQQERESIVDYRKRIYEYQKQIKKLNAIETASD